ncbi:MAG TPA: oligosaccharide flippase family protein, partial [Pseudomonadota bacterium]|nr:oligosaccharide flippase family protein [Pseudomonadota bacterium]
VRAMPWLAASYGFIRARVSLFSVTRSDVMGTWREHWSHGQWLASGTLAQWGSSQLSYFVVAAMLSPAATALFAASRNILGFTHVFLNGLENFVPNMMTRRLMDSGLGAMIRWLNRFQILTTALMTTYCIVIAVLAKPLLHVAFGDQYADAPKIVVLVAVSYLVIGLIRPLTIAVRVLGEPRWIFLAHLAAAIISLPLSAALIHVGGVFGAAISLIVAQVIAFIGVGFGYRRAVARARTARSAEDARTDESLAAAENAVA